MEEVRSREELSSAISMAEKLFYKEYLLDLKDKVVVKSFNNGGNIRLLKLKKFVFNQKENNIEKLTNVLSSINSLGATYGYIINSDGASIDIYLAIKTIEETAIGKDTLHNGLEGNFPGIEIENVYKEEINSVLNNRIFKRNFNNVCSLVTIPNEKDEKIDLDIQGIEKFIDSMIGEEYSVLILASSIKEADIRSIRSSLEQLYTTLTPFKATDFSFNENETENISKSIAEGITDTVTKTITQTTGVTLSESTTNTVGGSVTAGMSVGVNFFGAKGAVNTSVSANYSKSKTKGKSESNSKSDSEGNSAAKSKTDTVTEGSTKGEGRSHSFKTENKTIIEILNRIEKSLDRISESEDVGLFSFSTYFLSSSKDCAYRAAATYMGLVKGSKSGIENSYINIWDSNDVYYLDILNYLKSIEHPIFTDEDVKFSPTTLVNSRELARASNFPYKSIPGIPAMNFNAFARNVSTYDSFDGRKINLGKIFHMGRVEGRDVEIDLDSLTMHTFITGSTGAGKTNTCCKLIDEVIKNNVKVLIIEPAKGEYKNFFGSDRGFTTYGTNPMLTNILKINPFSFPKDIHVLEHIDRLIEILSNCWPLYAAMPAILKEAVERAYVKVGWNLQYSVSSTGKFPTFNNLFETLLEVIEESAYSQELKGNYIGSLVTRVKSLTTGLLGEIFKGEEVNANKLFEDNVIVDLSRIGSVETKSLIMGILFLKLYEFNMSKNIFTNNLKHITVLEEAHNLIRKSQGQAAEGSNIQSKSVEMISNGIAEMRAYGEGFVIVDQAPSILDDSAIRNTNTKVVLRLPDERDRILTGKSALLTEEQIFEVGRLRKGVGVIYQNNWLEPVLCKIDKFDGKEVHVKSKGNSYENINKEKRQLLNLLLCKYRGEDVVINKEECDKLKGYITNEILDKHTSRQLIKFIDEAVDKKKPTIFEKENNKVLAMVLAKITDLYIPYREIEVEEDLRNITLDLSKKLHEIYGVESRESIEIIKNILVYNSIIGEDNNRLVLDNWLNIFGKRGIV